MTLRIAVLTALALCAFAANSILCRMALTTSPIDPLAFTAIRLASGALTMGALVWVWRPKMSLQGTWLGGAALCSYAVAFSLAYTSIPTGTGALILFGTIQVGLIAYGLLIGERLSLVQTLGFFCAVSGLIVLLLPGLGAPPLLFGGLMVLSGLSWVVYTLVGRKATNATAATAGNFIRATPLGVAALVLWIAFGPSQGQAHNLVTGLGLEDVTGISLALLSGTVASGLGYVLWYAVIKELRVTHAATLQLSVPVIATFGGIVFMGEMLTAILAGASAAILCGVAMVVITPKKR